MIVIELRERSVDALIQHPFTSSKVNLHLKRAAELKEKKNIKGHSYKGRKRSWRPYQVKMNNLLFKTFWAKYL